MTAVEKPSAVTLVLAALAAPSFLGIVPVRTADEIAFRLGHLGWERTSQQVAAYLKPLCECDCPWFERFDTGLGWHEYKVSRFGLTDLHNKIPGAAAAFVSGGGSTR